MRGSRRGGAGGGGCGPREEGEGGWMVRSDDVDARPVDEFEGRLLEAPARQHDELERVVLAEQLVVAQDVDVPVGVDAVEHLEGDELFQVRHRGLRRAAQEAPLQLPQLRHRAALQADVHLSQMGYVFQDFS